MNKFLKELYENFPELEKSKESIDKVVYYLKDNKPVFNASNEFKSNLKLRLESIVWLKVNKKNNFLIFALPAFSFVFIVTWFLYYFKDMIFLGWNNVVKPEGIIEMKIDNNPIKIDDEVIFSDETEVEGNSSENNIENNAKVLEKTIIKKDNKITEKIWENTTLVAPIDNSPSLFNDSPETISFENDEISTVLDAVWEIYDFKIDKNNNIDYYFESNISSVWAWSSPNNDMEMSRSFKIQEDYETFMEFCKNNWWFIYEAGTDEICRVDKKECLSSDYINWTCEFIEIK